MYNLNKLMSYYIFQFCCYIIIPLIILQNIFKLLSNTPHIHIELSLTSF